MGSLTTPMPSGYISVDALDIIIDATPELTLNADTITSRYPMIIKSLDLIDVENGNIIYVISGYSTVSTSSTLVADYIGTVTLGYLIVG
jgi:hypothetical protein